MVDCLYRGGSSVPHPVSPAELQKGTHFLSVSCDDGAKSGGVRIATAFRVRIDGDEGDPSRVIVARLVLDEIAPCGVVDAGTDVDGARDVDAAEVDARDSSAEADVSDVAPEAGMDAHPRAVVDSQSRHEAGASAGARTGGQAAPPPLSCDPSP